MKLLDSPILQTPSEGRAPRVPIHKNTPAMMDVLIRIEGQLQISGERAEMKFFKPDANLAYLSLRVGIIYREQDRQIAVLDVACFTIAWLESLGLSTLDIHARIAAERVRQRQYFTERKFSFRVDSPLVDDLRKLRVLIEEVGEVAEAIDSYEAHPQSRQYRNHLIEELIQVAAVTVAWLESFETNNHAKA